MPAMTDYQRHKYTLHDHVADAILLVYEGEERRKNPNTSVVVAVSNCYSNTAAFIEPS